MRRRRPLPKPLLPVLAALAVLAIAVPRAAAVRRPDVTVVGLRSGQMVGASQLSGLSVRVTPRHGGDAMKATLDGRPLTADRQGKAYVYAMSTLRDGRHEMKIAVDRGFPFGTPVEKRSFRVDTAAPRLDVTAPANVDRIDKPVTLSGRVEPGARLLADGKAVKLDKGAFSLRYPAPPPAVHLVATDVAGNATVRDIRVPVRYPHVRAAHLTALAWNSAALREPVLDLARQKKLDAVELDIKDEAGVVGYDSHVPLAREIGAATKIYDLRKTTDQLHAMGLRVIGRIVVFRDPVLASAAWSAGRRDQVIQTPDGQPYKGRYGGFTNFANATVRQYNIDLGVEARRGGFDDILYDYVRRPDGPLSTMVFPGIQGSPEDEIVRFMADSHRALRSEGAFLGASVFGIAATRPTEIAQDVPSMAKEADFIAPMVYPSHWGKGEYKVADPNRQPYDIVRRSLDDFTRDVQGTDATIVPWLQDFSLGVPYGPAEVQAQIRAAADAGIPDFLLWNAGARYTGAALTPKTG